MASVVHATQRPEGASHVRRSSWPAQSVLDAHCAHRPLDGLQRGALSGQAPPSGHAVAQVCDVGSQRWPFEQSPSVPHCTQTCDAVSQRGVSPWHCESLLHCTQTPEAVSQ